MCRNQPEHRDPTRDIHRPVVTPEQNHSPVCDGQRTYRTAATETIATGQMDPHRDNWRESPSTPFIYRLFLVKQ